MSDTKNLSVKLPQSLHEQISDSKDKSGLNLNDYIAKIITEYYEGESAMGKTKTIAIQVSEELRERLTGQLNEMGLSLKQFLTELIENAISETEVE